MDKGFAKISFVFAVTFLFTVYTILTGINLNSYSSDAFIPVSPFETGNNERRTHKLSTAHESDECRILFNKYKCEDLGALPTGVDEDNDSIICSFDLAFHTQYLPNATLVACLEKLPPLAWQENGEKMQNMIYKIQNPQEQYTCDRPNSTSFVIPSWETVQDKFGHDSRDDTGHVNEDDAPKWNLVSFLHHGFAYNTWIFAWNVGNHWTTGVPTILSNNLYRFSDRKCGNHWTCYFTELSSCKIEDIPPTSVLVYNNAASDSNVMSLDQLCTPGGQYNLSTGRCECEPNFMPGRSDSYTGCAPYDSFDFESSHRKTLHKQAWENKRPRVYNSIRYGDDNYFSQLGPGEANPRLSRNKLHSSVFAMDPANNVLFNLQEEYGFLYTHSQFLWYLFKDNPRKAILDKDLAHMGFQRNQRRLALHVRHGDACHDRALDYKKCFDLSHYIPYIEKMEQQYGKFDAIYLATDDPAVIKATRFFPQYNFLYQKIDRAVYETDDKRAVDERYEFNEPQMVHQIVLDIWAMSNCDAFVGSWTSSVAWVSYELMMAKKGYYPPFISVHLPLFDRKLMGKLIHKTNYH